MSKTTLRERVGEALGNGAGPWFVVDYRLQSAESGDCSNAEHDALGLELTDAGTVLVKPMAGLGALDEIDARVFWEVSARYGEDPEDPSVTDEEYDRLYDRWADGAGFAEPKEGLDEALTAHDLWLADQAMSVLVKAGFSVCKDAGYPLLTVLA